jgi:subtilisin family serine protease
MVFDEGAVRTSHQEFQDAQVSRVKLFTQTPLSLHATHVAGTIAAKGVVSQATGMAGQVALHSFDWEDDLLKLDQNGSDAASVSNHSYGPITGWYQDERGVWYWWGDTKDSSVEDSRYGKYTLDAAQLDDVLNRRQNLVTLVAAGNERGPGNSPEIQPIQHFVIGVRPDNTLEWQRSVSFHYKDDFDRGGLDTISGMALAKNAICVGAVDDIKTGENGERKISTTHFSSWGPTDDGRIKPDIVANGFRLYSVSDVSDTAYAGLSGTSMACPTASGICCLLIEHFKAVRNREPLSAEIKALLIHTAVDDSERPGPDPVYGWGAINALAAGRILQVPNGEQRLGTLLDSITVKSKEEVARDFTSDGRPIRVTVVWNDPKGEENLSGLDDATPSLVNNLDVKLIGPGGREYYPYSLVPNDPFARARADRTNEVDNVEVIDAPSTTGDWRVVISGAKLKSDTSQSFTVVVSGLKEK